MMVVRGGMFKLQIPAIFLLYTLSVQASALQSAFLGCEVLNSTNCRIVHQLLPVPALAQCCTLWAPPLAKCGLV